MSGISTHILDTALGKPAAGVRVELEQRTADAWINVGAGTTDADGRCRNLVSAATQGLYRLTLATGEYFAGHRRKSIYPEIVITFQCDGDAHYHLPVLLADNSYTTYRGS